LPKNEGIVVRMRLRIFFSVLVLMSTFGCTAPTTTPLPANTGPASTSTRSLPAPTGTASTTPTQIFTETTIPSETPLPSPSITPTALPTVESLEATVIADRLSCRYGPGPEYLYLFAFRSTARIELIGRVDAGNWDWVLVENQVPCWVHADFLEVQGDLRSLPVVYPGIAKLPITPYYPRSEVLSAERDAQTNEITLSWVDVPVSLGDYEDDSMQTYIIELWRCQDGELIFDPLATRLAFIQFVDEAGCSEPSHGRVWVQEKHGYAGPAEIPWPQATAP
jgi:hypothetical protein